MSTQINKNTLLYGSFSTNPGNNGTIFFNNAFKLHNVDAIYKSFYSDSIEDTIKSIKHLKFSGIALSMPHKVSVIPLLDSLDEISTRIGAVNTILNINNSLIGYNTDYFGVMQLFKEINIRKSVNIIGNGGFSKAIQCVCEDMDILFNIIGREYEDSLSKCTNELFINATPVDILSETNSILDLRPNTEMGKQVSKYQAIKQFKLYTDIDYE